MQKYIATKYLRISYTDDKADESNSVAVFVNLKIQQMVTKNTAHAQR